MALFGIPLFSHRNTHPDADSNADTDTGAYVIHSLSNGDTYPDADSKTGS